MRLTTLAELPPLGTPSKGMLVVKVEQPHADDSAALERLSAWGWVFVLATFPLPTPGPDSQWKRAVWQSDAAWREAFVAWVARRVSERGEEAPRQLVAMVRAAWRDPRRVWPAVSPGEAWEARFPIDGLPHSDQRIEAARAEVARARKQTVAKARDTALAEAERLLESPDRPRQAVAAMREAGMFGQAPGGWAAGSPWMQEVLAQEEVVKALGHDPAVWGRWTVDLARRPLVDGVLRALSDTDFEGLLQRVLETADLSVSLGGAAALETLFLHAAERMEAGTALDQDARCERRRLFEQSRALWVRGVQEGLPASRTRGGPGEPSRDSARWIAACWVWSLGMKAPKQPLPDGWKTVKPYLRVVAQPGGKR